MLFIFFSCATKIPESTFAIEVSQAQTQPFQLHVFSMETVPRQPPRPNRLSDTVRKAEPSTLKPQELLHGKQWKKQHRDVLGNIALGIQIPPEVLVF